jgi:hypothetical protein
VFAGELVVAWDDDDDELSEEELEEREEEREDLKTALVQARKKPRHFAIIAKGPEILALVAQRKPIRAGMLRQLRREKKGKQVIQGICQGEGGTSLVFKVEGEAPKIKKSRLREYISGEAGLMVKPTFTAAATPKK